MHWLDQASDLCFFLALVSSLEWYSLHPGIPVMNAFWFTQFRYPLSNVFEPSVLQLVRKEDLPWGWTV